MNYNSIFKLITSYNKDEHKIYSIIEGPPPIVNLTKKKSNGENWKHSNFNGYSYKK